MGVIQIERTTVNRPIRFQGKGLHSGAPVAVTLFPSAEGVRFRWNGEWVSAVPGAVSDTTRSTSLGPVRTIEHLMSALSGVGVTDVDVDLTAPELPAMDGSAAPFVEGLLQVGFEGLGMSGVTFPDDAVVFREGNIAISVAAGQGVWSYRYLSEQLWPFDQLVEVDLTRTSYAEGVAFARTFVHEREMDVLRERGLARGLDPGQLLVVGDHGYLTDSRAAHEQVTHKLLDLMGDLYLTGVPARYLNVTAKASGHRTNVAAARRILTAATADCP